MWLCITDKTRKRNTMGVVRTSLRHAQGRSYDSSDGKLLWFHSVDFSCDLHNISHIELLCEFTYEAMNAHISPSIIMQNKCMRTFHKQSISDCNSTSFTGRPWDSNSTFQANKCRRLWNIKLEIFLSLGDVNKQWRHCNELYKKHLSAQIGASNRGMVIECSWVLLPLRVMDLAPALQGSRDPNTRLNLTLTTATVRATKRMENQERQTN